jgi:predicted Zn-dependent protease
MGDLKGASAILDSREVDRKAQSFWRLKGEILEAANDLPGALKAYTKARSMSPSNYSVTVAIARILARQGRHKEALKLADEAIGKDSREWEPHKIKADAFHALGREEDVERELKDARARLFAIGLRPDDAW